MSRADTGDEGRQVVGSLPSSLLPVDAVDSLDESDRISQAAPVRSIVANGGWFAYQILLIVDGRGLLGLFLDPTRVSTGWQVVFDSTVEPCGLPDDEYWCRAHDTLALFAVESSSSYVESSLRRPRTEKSSFQHLAAVRPHAKARW